MNDDKYFAVDGGWSPRILELAKAIIVECRYCGKDLDLKGKGFGVMKEPFQHYEKIAFSCPECSGQIGKFFDEMKSKKNGGGE